MNVRLTQDQKVKILNSDDVFKVMQQILMRENKIRRNQEHFLVVGLGNKNKVLFIELVSLGSVNIVQVKPREIFRMAIYKMAVQMILVHNHPSGEVDPSEADKDLTDRLLKSGDMLGIEVIEHLIISEKEYLSFADTGVIRELKRSGKYVLIDREKAELTEWKLQVEREQAVNEFAKEMAKKMKDDGQDIDTIKKYTGLRKWDIKKL